MIVSFSWTTPALLAGVKTATSREWSDSYLARWQRAFDQGRRRHQAYDRAPYRGGKQVGWITLTERPVRKRIRDYTDEEAVAEGVGCATAAEFRQWMQGAGFTGDEEFTLLRFTFERMED